MPNALSEADLRRLALLPPFKHPQVYGRDWTNPYYDFLAHVVQAMEPNLVVELGTCTGGSTSYLAASGAKKVISIDIAQQDYAKKRLATFSNLELWERDTKELRLIDEIRALGPVDLLFIDTDHTPDQAGLELERYGPLVARTGLILFDDIDLDEPMRKWWSSLDGSKLGLPGLHWSGFGCRLAYWGPSSTQGL